MSRHLGLQWRDHDSLLHRVVRFGHVEATRYLLGAGAKVDSGNVRVSVEKKSFIGCLCRGRRRLSTQQSWEC